MLLFSFIQFPAKSIYFRQNLLMKKLLTLLLIITVSGCNNAPQPVTTMAGVYEMASQSVKGPGIDTVITGQKLIKLYTADQAMFVRLNPADGESGFGVGTYLLDSGKLKEQVIYAITDTIETTSAASGAVEVTRTDSGYKQSATATANGNTMHFAEDYKYIGDTATSVLDGVWQQVSGYTVTGKDTVKWKDVQYKGFYRGHFLYGNVAADRAGIKHTFISAGTFAVTDSSYLRQTITLATDPFLHGKSFYLAIAMNGADRFIQTNTSANGDKEVLLYERLGK